MVRKNIITIHDYSCGIGAVCDGYDITHSMIDPEKGSCNDVLIWHALIISESNQRKTTHV